MTTTEITRLIVDRIIKERRVKGLTQVDLSKKSNIPLGTIKAMETKGTASLDVIVSVSKALGRVQILQSFFDFNEEYKMLGYDQYQQVLKKQEAKKVTKYISDKIKNW